MRFFDELLHLFFPVTCPGCDTPLLRNERLFCTACSFDLPYTRMHDEPDNILEKRFWGKCPLMAATSLFHFVPGGKVQQALHRLKYQSDRRTGKALGKLLGHELKQSERFQSIRAVLHVPLHPDKLKSRGFDQSLLLAEGVAEAMEIEQHSEMLKRMDATETQTRKGRYERWLNVSQAFQLVDSSDRLEGPVLIVDDVLTTGSTLEACARSILREGKGPVAVATIACA